MAAIEGSRSVDLTWSRIAAIEGSRAFQRPELAPLHVAAAERLLNYECRFLNVHWN